MEEWKGRWGGGGREVERWGRRVTEGGGMSLWGDEKSRRKCKNGREVER